MHTSECPRDFIQYSSTHVRAYHKYNIPHCTLVNVREQTTRECGDHRAPPAATQLLKHHCQHQNINEDDNFFYLFEAQNEKNQILWGFIEFLRCPSVSWTLALYLVCGSVVFVQWIAWLKVRLNGRNIYLSLHRILPHVKFVKQCFTFCCCCCWTIGHKIGQKLLKITKLGQHLSRYCMYLLVNFIENNSYWERMWHQKGYFLTNRLTAISLRL